MPGDTWDPLQYDRFRDERRAPFWDLAALVRPRPGMRIVDLGCGTGELTRALHEHLTAAETLGIDSSAAMLSGAERLAAPGFRLVQGSIEAVRDVARWDLVFSNAALHWIPRHADLLARLTAALAPGGQLAVQMPANFHHPSHRVAAEVARETPFRDALAGWSFASPVLEPADYAVLLHRLGYRAQHVRLQVYGHPLAGWEDVVEWVKGTLLTAYEARLGPALHAQFVARYRARLGEVLENPHPYFFTFNRLLLWGERPD